MKTLINTLSSQIEAGQDYIKSKDYLEYYADMVGDLFAHKPTPSVKAIALQLFDVDYIDNAFFNDNARNAFKPFGIDFYEFCEDYITYNFTIDYDKNIKTDYSIWLDKNAIFDIESSEHEFEIAIKSPFKTGIIEYLERNTDAIINDNGYGYLITPRIKYMADREEILNEFLEWLYHNDKLEVIYLDWFNNYLTAAKFAEHNFLNEGIAHKFVDKMRELMA